MPKYQNNRHTNPTWIHAQGLKITHTLRNIQILNGNECVAIDYIMSVAIDNMKFLVNLVRYMYMPSLLTYVL